MNEGGLCEVERPILPEAIRVRGGRPRLGIEGRQGPVLRAGIHRPEEKAPLHQAQYHRQGDSAPKTPPDRPL